MYQSSRRLSSVVRHVSVFAALLWVATTAHAQQTPQRYFIEFREYGPGSAALVRAFGGTPVHEFATYRTIAAWLPEPALLALMNAPGIVRIERDAERYPLAQTTPYGISMVQANLVPAASDASNAMVCVIDSGYTLDHPDLPGTTGTMPTGDSDTGGAGDWAIDNCGHGTHVAGTIAALNNDVGVVGVIPGGNLPLHIVKVFGDSCSWTYSSDLIAALNKCAAAGAKIVSMSLGGALPTTLEEAAFNDAYTNGVLPIAAAGNGGNTAISYPAGYSSVMSVGAVAQDGVIAWFSQQNADVELVAPGVGVLSTVPWLNENSVTADGTTYFGNWIENAARSESVIGDLADGGLCDSVGAWQGKVVLCQRGIITFFEKVMNVQTGGGVAAIAYNNVPGNFLGTLGLGNTSAIPAISLSQEDGERLVGNKLGLQGTVVSWSDPHTAGYEAWDGTSMATPHVSGVAALLWSHKPTWTNGDIRRSLQATAADLGQAGIDTSYGFGLVQALAAYNLSSPPPTADPMLLSGRGDRVKGRRQAALNWTGGSARVNVFRNGIRVAIAIANTGAFTDSLPKGGNSFVYRVCEAHGATSGATCSNDVTITF
jgi:serine protease